VGETDVDPDAPHPQTNTMTPKLRTVISRKTSYATHMPPRAQTDHRELLARHQIKQTRQRLRILKVLASEPHDATAQTIHARLRDQGDTTGLATVYRTLALLSERGAIDALMHRPGETCYRLCGDGHHHHLVCTQCHRVIELGECELDPWLDKLAATHDFIVTQHTVEVTGLCASCRDT
jgi:Fur family transcriptional regulator, ferric uptake regulator